MRVSIIVALVGSVLVVLGVSAALITTTTDAGSGILDAGKSFGKQVECLLMNKEEPREECGKIGEKEGKSGEEDTPTGVE